MSDKILGPVLNERGLRYRRNILLVSAALLLIGLADEIEASNFAPFGLAIGNHIWWIGLTVLIFQHLIYWSEVSACWQIWKPGLNFKEVHDYVKRNIAATSKESPLLLFGLPGPKWFKPDPPKRLEVEWRLRKVPDGNYEHELFHFSGRRFRYFSKDRAEPVEGVSRYVVTRRAFLNARRRFLEFALVDVGAVALMSGGAIWVGVKAL